MTKNQQAVAWGLTSFFGVVCLAAAPQLSIGLFIKYGIVSTALGFGITAISNAVGNLFPDDGTDSPSSYSESGSTVHHHHHHTQQRRGLWDTLFYNNSYVYSGSGSNRQTSGEYLGTRYEPVSPNQTPTFGTNTTHSKHLGTRYEPVQNTGFGSWFSENNTKPTEQYVSSRTESVIPTYSPGYSSSTSKPDTTYLGSTYEPVTDNSTKPDVTHVGIRYEKV